MIECSYIPNFVAKIKYNEGCFQFLFTINEGMFSLDLILRSILIELSVSNEEKIDFGFDVKKYTLKNRVEILSLYATIHLKRGCL